MIIPLLDGNGDAEAGGFDADEPIFGVVGVCDGLFGAGLFLEVAVVVVTEHHTSSRIRRLLSSYW